MEYYDIVVIGSGPSGQKAAIQGAKFGQRVVVIEQGIRVGGACVHHPTVLGAPARLHQLAGEESTVGR